MEQSILDLLLNVVDRPTRENIKLQLSEVNRVQREARGFATNMYVIRRGKPDNAGGARLSDCKGELLFCKVTFQPKNSKLEKFEGKSLFYPRSYFFNRF